MGFVEGTRKEAEGIGLLCGLVPPQPPVDWHPKRVEHAAQGAVLFTRPHDVGHVLGPGGPEGTDQGRGEVGVVHERHEVVGPAPIAQIGALIDAECRLHGCRVCSTSFRI